MWLCFVSIVVWCLKNNINPLQFERRIFVITKQPMNVQKIVQAKSTSMSMCVRLLGGKGLGIEHSLPSVSMQVYSEQKLEAALKADGPTRDGECRNLKPSGEKL